MLRINKAWFKPSTKSKINNQWKSLLAVSSSSSARHCQASSVWYLEELQPPSHWPMDGARGQEESQETAGGAGDCTETLHWTTLLLDPVIECFVTGNQPLRRESPRGPQRQPRDNRCQQAWAETKSSSRRDPVGTGSVMLAMFREAIFKDLRGPRRIQLQTKTKWQNAKLKMKQI